MYAVSFYPDFFLILNHVVYNHQRSLYVIFQNSDKTEKERGVYVTWITEEKQIDVCLLAYYEAIFQSEF